MNETDISQTFTSGGWATSDFDPIEESDVDLVQRLWRWLYESEGSIVETGWLTESREDYDFIAGHQDTREGKAILEAQKRPTTTYNTILPKINMLVGVAAQTNRAPYVFPTGSDDEALTELMNGAFKYVRKQVEMGERENECFEHGAKSGRSFLHFYLDKSNPFKVQIKVKRIPGRDVKMDPMSVEYDLSDSRYIFSDKWFSYNEIRGLIPDFPTEEIKALANTRTEIPIFYDTVTDKFRLTECWYRLYVDMYWFKNPFTKKVESLFKKEFLQYKKALEQIKPDIAKNLQVTITKTKKIFYCIFSAMKVLERGVSPYKHDYFPYVLYGAYKDENENRWFSVVNMMKDPQRGRNAMRRQLLHLLNTSQKGILVHETGVIINEDEYDAKSSEPNFRLVVRKGGIEKYKFTEQPQISPIYAQLDTMFEIDLKLTSGIVDDLMGIETSSREPGVTLRLRQQAGLAVLYILFDHFKRSRIIGGKILLIMIQQFVTEEQVIRIEGMEGAELIKINSQTNPQSTGFNDITAGEYDLNIDEALDSQTMRMVIAQLLTEFNSQNPGTIPPDLIMEYSDLPLSAQNKVRKYNEMQRQREDAMFAIEQETKRHDTIHKAASVVEASKVRATASAGRQKSNIAKPKSKSKQGGK
jgi:hypothetical protein